MGGANENWRVGGVVGRILYRVHQSMYVQFEFLQDVEYDVEDG